MELTDDLLQITLNKVQTILIVLLVLLVIPNQGW
jgi:hypothetical protein